MNRCANSIHLGLCLAQLSIRPLQLALPEAGLDRQTLHSRHAFEVSDSALLNDAAGDGKQAFGLLCRARKTGQL